MTTNSETLLMIALDATARWIGEALMAYRRLTPGIVIREDSTYIAGMADIGQLRDAKQYYKNNPGAYSEDMLQDLLCQKRVSPDTEKLDDVTLEQFTRIYGIVPKPFDLSRGEENICRFCEGRNGLAKTAYDMCSCEVTLFAECRTCSISFELLADNDECVLNGFCHTCSSKVCTEPTPAELSEQHQLGNEKLRPMYGISAPPSPLRLERSHGKMKLSQVTEVRFESCVEEQEISLEEEIDPVLVDAHHKSNAQHCSSTTEFEGVLLEGDSRIYSAPPSDSESGDEESVEDIRIIIQEPSGSEVKRVWNAIACVEEAIANTSQSTEEVLTPHELDARVARAKIAMEILNAPGICLKMIQEKMSLSLPHCPPLLIDENEMSKGTPPYLYCEKCWKKFYVQYFSIDNETSTWKQCRQCVMQALAKSRRTPNIILSRMREACLFVGGYKIYVQTDVTLHGWQKGFYFDLNSLHGIYPNPVLYGLMGPRRGKGKYVVHAVHMRHIVQNCCSENIRVIHFSTDTVGRSIDQTSLIDQFSCYQIAPGKAFEVNEIYRVGKVNPVQLPFPSCSPVCMAPPVNKAFVVFLCVSRRNSWKVNTTLMLTFDVSRKNILT